MTYLKTADWNGSGDCRNDNLKMYACKSLIINKALFLTLPAAAAINELNQHRLFGGEFGFFPNLKFIFHSKKY